MTRGDVAICLIGVLSLCSAALGDVRYGIMDICPQSAEVREKFAINDAGDVVGTYFAPHGPEHAFLFSGGVFTDLGSGNFPSFAYDINNSGQIAMNFRVPGGGTHAGLYDHGAFTDITDATANSPGGPLRAVLSINNLGHMAGVVGDHAALFDGTTVWDLGTIGDGISEAVAINDSDHVAGFVTFNATTIFQSSRTVYYDSALHDVMPTIQTYSRAMNASDQIAGATVIQMSPGGFQQQRAMLYANGELTDMGSLGGNYSEALGINDHGEAVGWTGTGAFVYADGVMTDLNTLIDPAAGWQLVEADAINNGGQIVALANSGKLYEEVLLTPVPEPGMGVIIGCALLGVRRRGNSCNRI